MALIRKPATPAARPAAPAPRAPAKAAPAPRAPAKAAPARPAPAKAARDDGETRPAKTKAELAEIARRRAAREALSFYQAGESLRHMNVEVFLRVGEDGLVRQFKVNAVRGNPAKQEAPRMDMMVYDPTTAAQILSRLQSRMACTAAVIERRTPPGSSWYIAMRVGVTKEGGIRVSYSDLRLLAPGSKKWQSVKATADQPEDWKLHIRKLNGARTVLRGAFVNAVPVPTATDFNKLRQRLIAEEA